jgi:Lsr2
MAMRRIFVIGIATMILMAGALAGMLAFRPAPTRAAAPFRAAASSVELGRCPAQIVAAREVEMATKTTMTLEDDLVGGPADETLRFGLGGTEYEIDLNAKNASAFRRQLAPFVEHARKAGRDRQGGTARTASSRARSGGIRQWAKDHGIEVSDRGRIPAKVTEQYEAATRVR